MALGQTSWPTLKTMLHLLLKKRAGTNPNILVDKTKSAGDGLETAHTKTRTDKDTNNAEKDASFDPNEFNTSPELTNSNDAKEIKIEDLSKLVKNVGIKLTDLDSPKDDTPFTFEDDEDEESQNLKLDKEKAKAKAKVALLTAQPSYLNVEQLTELLVTSLKPKLTKLLTDHDFSASLPKKLKELPTKFSEICREIKDLKKYVHEMEIDLLGDLKETSTNLEEFQSTISSLIKQLSKLKTLDALLSLLNKFTKALNMLAQAIKSASHTAGDDSVPLSGQAGLCPIEWEKNIICSLTTDFNL
uniref:Uncharacterized protein n=1 Tax=Tanacetum cinerariifolium TaxID=118510 RepID=A0A6L2M8J5_TANCI|nr:hypothetical protein [Tanacetum cinerariifolium]